MLENDHDQNISKQASTRYCKTQWYEPEHFIYSVKTVSEVGKLITTF